jgi:hypothetical protein
MGPRSLVALLQRQLRWLYTSDEIFYRMRFRLFWRSMMNKLLIIKTSLAALALSAAFGVAAQDQNSGNHNGGLMKQMMNEQYKVKTIHDPAVQQRLSEIDLGDTSHESNH